MASRVARIGLAWLALVSALIALSLSFLAPSADDGWAPVSPWAALPFTAAACLFAFGALRSHGYASGSRRWFPPALIALAAILGLIGGVTGLLLYAPGVALLLLAWIRR